MSESEELDLLMQAARGGDSAAYRRLLDKAAGQLRAYFVRRLTERSDAEDMVQECLIAMHSRRESHDPTRPVAPWMFAIARYKLVDHYRRSGRRMTMELDEELAGESDSHAGHDVERLLGELPEAQAEAIRLTKLKGYSGEEAAEISGAGVAAVKVRVHRGLARLRNIVSEGGE
jgi:RNA polymerase sigma-70 factor (ECF subfamily)